MIDLIMCGTEEATAEVVSKAFERSFTRGQVRCGNRAPLPDSKIVVAISPVEEDVDWLKTFSRKGGKILLFGSLGPHAARFAGIAVQGSIENLAADCPPATAHCTSESSAALVYVSQGVGDA